MDIFKRKRVNRNERIVLETPDEVVELDSSPMGPGADKRPIMAEPAAAADSPQLKDLSDLELLGAFVVSRGKGDRSTMATVQRELEKRGKAEDIAHL